VAFKGKNLKERSLMDSYIVRIYRREPGDPCEVAGTVEEPGLRGLGKATFDGEENYSISGHHQAKKRRAHSRFFTELGQIIISNS
jgi:hypothetical protein